MDLGATICTRSQPGLRALPGREGLRGAAGGPHRRTAVARASASRCRCGTRPGWCCGTRAPCCSSGVQARASGAACGYFRKGRRSDSRLIAEGIFPSRFPRARKMPVIEHGFTHFRLDIRPIRCSVRRKLPGKEEHGTNLAGHRGRNGRRGAGAGEGAAVRPAGAIRRSSASRRGRPSSSSSCCLTGPGSGRTSASRAPTQALESKRNGWAKMRSPCSAAMRSSSRRQAARRSGTGASTSSGSNSTVARARPSACSRRSRIRKRCAPCATICSTPSCCMSHWMMRARQPTASGVAGAPTSAPFADQADAERRPRRAGRPCPSPGSAARTGAAAAGRPGTAPCRAERAAGRSPAGSVRGAEAAMAHQHAPLGAEGRASCSARYTERWRPPVQPMATVR